MPIRGSPNGANALVHAIHTPDVIAGMGGRHQSERVDVINRNRWSSSSGAPSVLVETRNSSRKVKSFALKRYVGTSQEQKPSARRFGCSRPTCASN